MIINYWNSNFFAHNLQIRTNGANKIPTMIVQVVSFAFVVVCICVIKRYSFNIEKDLWFRLYTREDPTSYYVLSGSGYPEVSGTPFNSSRPTRIFIHGFKSKEKVIKRYTEAYLEFGDFNFIAVDWMQGTSTYNYYLAKSRTRLVSWKQITCNSMSFQFACICRLPRSWLN